MQHDTQIYKGTRLLRQTAKLPIVSNVPAINFWSSHVTNSALGCIHIEAPSQYWPSSVRIHTVFHQGLTTCEYTQDDKNYSKCNYGRKQVWTLASENMKRVSSTRRYKECHRSSENLTGGQIRTNHMTPNTPTITAIECLKSNVESPRKGVDHFLTIQM